jgi:hypothetical protein
MWQLVLLTHVATGTLKIVAQALLPVLPGVRRRSIKAEHRRITSIPQQRFGAKRHIKEDTRQRGPDRPSRLHQGGTQLRNINMQKRFGA